MDAAGLILAIPGSLEMLIKICRQIYDNFSAYPTLSGILDSILQRCSELRGILANLKPLAHRTWGESVLKQSFMMGLATSQRQLDEAAGELRKICSRICSTPNRSSSATVVKLMRIAREFKKWMGAAWTKKRLQNVEGLVEKSERSIRAIASRAHGALKDDQLLSKQDQTLSKQDEVLAKLSTMSRAIAAGQDQLPSPSTTSYERDLFAELPPEIPLRIFPPMDRRSICREAQVSKDWWSRESDWRVRFYRRWGDAARNWEFGVRSERSQDRAMSLENEGGVALNPSLDQVITNLQGRWLQWKGYSVRREPYMSPEQASTSSTSTPTQDERPKVHDWGEIKTWKQLYAFRQRLHLAWRSGLHGPEEFEGHSGPILAAQVQGEHVITASADNTIKVWSMRSRKLVRTLKGHTDAVTCLQFDMTKLVSGSMDATVRFWDYETGLELESLCAECGGVTCMTYDRSSLVCGTALGKMVVLQYFGKRETRMVDGHKCSIKAAQLHRHDTVISLGQDGIVKVWDLRKMICTVVLEEDLGRVGCFMPFSRLQLRGWPTLMATDGNHEQEPGTSETWASAQKPRSSDPPPVSSIVMKTCRDRIHSLREHLDPTPLSSSHLLISGSTDGIVSIWDMATSTPIREFFGQRAAISALDFDHNHLASAGEDGVFKVWDLDTGEEILEVRGAHKGAINAVQVGEFGMLTAGNEGDVKLWTVDVCQRQA